jgi:hypothetical protein
VILNVHAPTEDKIDDVKDNLQRVFDKFAKYHMKILLGDFNAKVGREDIFKPIIGHESLHEISNDNGILPHLKTSESKVRCSHIAVSINIHGRLRKGETTTRLTIFW